MDYHTNHVQVLCEGCVRFKECKHKKTFDFTVERDNGEQTDFKMLEPMLDCEQFERNGLTVV